MMLNHIGRQEKAALLEKALDICCADPKHGMSSDNCSVTAESFANFVMYTITNLENKAASVAKVI